MTTTTDHHVTSSHQATGTPVACGIAGGALGVVCCSVGILGAAFFGLGAAAGFAAFDEASPIGARPLLILGAFALALALTWALTRTRVRDLPHSLAQAAMRRALFVSAVTTALTYFVLMQFVIPVLFITGGADMGQFKP